MAEDASVDQKILRTLGAMGVDPSSLDGRTLEQLGRMEERIAALAAAHHAARAEARRNMITKENVARDGGVSRPTINAKPVLERYIEHRRVEEKVFYEGEQVASLRRRLREAEEKVEKLARRDGELVAALAEAERLRERNRRLEEYIGDLPPYMREELETMGRVVPLPQAGKGMSRSVGRA